MEEPVRRAGSVLGPFSRAVDLVQSEYGWSDGRVLDLPLSRLRQVVEAITERHQGLARERWAQVVWQTRQICGFVGSTVDVDTSKTGGVNPLMEAARDLGKEFLFEDDGPAYQERHGSELTGDLPNPEDAAVAVGEVGPESEAERVAKLADRNPMGAVRLFAGKLEEGRP